MISQAVLFIKSPKSLKVAPRFVIERLSAATATASSFSSSDHLTYLHVCRISRRRRPVDAKIPRKRPQTLPLCTKNGPKLIIDYLSGRTFRLAAAASPLQLPRSLPAAHRAYRPCLEVDRLARCAPRFASCNPCTCSGCAGARRRLTRRSPCTRSSGAGARRCCSRRSPFTRSDDAGARRCCSRRSPCTRSDGAGARRCCSRRSPSTRWC